MREKKREVRERAAHALHQEGKGRGGKRNSESVRFRECISEREPITFLKAHKGRGRRRVNKECLVSCAYVCVERDLAQRVHQWKRGGERKFVRRCACVYERERERERSPRRNIGENTFERKSRIRVTKPILPHEIKSMPARACVSLQAAQERHTMNVLQSVGQT